MRKLLIACLNLLLIFNNIGFQAINATEVDPPSEETYEPSLPTEETNSDDSIKENTDTIVSTEEETNVDNTENNNLPNNIDEKNNYDTDLSAEKDINTIDDLINEENTLEINDSFEDEQISTVATRAIAFLDKEKFRNNLPQKVTNLYFGTESDYDLSKCTQTINIGNNYTLYTYEDDSTYDAYVICQDGKQIFFPEDSSNLFYRRSKLKQITFKNIDTSYVTNMNNMFIESSSLTSIDLANFDTRNVTDMYQMFGDCENLTSLDLSNFNTSKVTSMGDMFYYCKSLTSMDLSNFNTENVTNMYQMFYGCESLTSMDLSNFNTENVTDMSGMFTNCTNLTSLDLSNFNTENVTNMVWMFSGCRNLTSLDLSNFNTQNVSDQDSVFYGMNRMFLGCNKLKTIYASNLFTASKNNSKYMFENCTSLIGGLGTKYDSSKTDYEYAHIDGGTSNPGYFSCKHIWDEGKVTTEPTCVNKGIKTFKCTKCDATKTEDIVALGHEYSPEWTVDIEPTCTKEGIESHHCTRCDAKTGDRPIAKTDHIWDSGVVTTEPTCETKGTKTFKCTKCNTTKTEDIAALGHSYTAETIKADALKTPGTCTDKAIYYKSCERCGQVDTDENNTFEGEVDSTNHNYSPEWTVDIEPTCTKEGIESHHCTRCDAKTGDRPIAKTDHIWDSGVVTTEPTCETKGTKTFKCTKCNTTKTEDVAALGHKLTHVAKKDATTEEFGNIEYWNCSKCKKNFSDSEGTNEITDSTVIPKLAPRIIKGDNQSVTEKEEKALSVTSNASYDDFIEVKVDGTTLDISKYAKAKGSTIITLNSDYVSTLSVGTHTLDVVSKFGTATAHFKVEKKVEITPIPETNKSSTTDKTSTGWDDGGPFTTDKCGNVFDRWNNKIYEANGCNVGGYNLVRTSVIE